MRRKIEQPTLKDKFKKIPKLIAMGRVGEAVEKHLSDREREEFKSKIMMALVLELENIEGNYKRLYDDHIQLMSKVGELELKLKRKKTAKK